MTETLQDPIVPVYEFPEEEDMQAFWNDPKEACEGMQRKYIGMTFEEYERYWETLIDFEGEPGPYQEIIDETFSNPYTHEKKTIKVLHDLPVPTPEEIINARIQELRLKLIAGTITDAEREELKLLIG